MNYNANQNHQLATVLPIKNSVDNLMSSPEIREKIIQSLEKIRIEIDAIYHGSN